MKVNKINKHISKFGDFELKLRSCSQIFLAKSDFPTSDGTAPTTFVQFLIDGFS
jgi:hypothetical protein